MTLQEWSQQTGISIVKTATGATNVFLFPYADPSRDWELWQLSDFAVSSRIGPVVWLIPRSPREEYYNES